MKKQIFDIDAREKLRTELDKEIREIRRIVRENPNLLTQKPGPSIEFVRKELDRRTRDAKRMAKQLGESFIELYNTSIDSDELALRQIDHRHEKQKELTERIFANAMKVSMWPEHISLLFCTAAAKMADDLVEFEKLMGMSFDEYNSMNEILNQRIQQREK